MSALLEIPEIRRQAFAVSVESYHRLTEGLRTELLRGTIIEKMSKSPAHQYYADRIREILTGQITPEWIVRQEGPLTFADSEPEPDVAIVPGPRSLYRDAHPATAVLVVEVAVSSVAIDRVKAAIYAEAGVKEYWMVCPEDRSVEVFRQPTRDGYLESLRVTAPAVLTSDVFPAVQVDLGALFA